MIAIIGVFFSLSQKNPCSAERGFFNDFSK